MSGFYSKMNAGRITIHLKTYMLSHLSLTESFTNLVFHIHFMTLGIKLTRFGTVPLILLYVNYLCYDWLTYRYQSSVHCM